MDAFNVTMGFRIHYGEGASEKVGEWVAPYRAKKVMVVTDTGILSAGLDAPLLRGLRSAGLEVFVFHDVDPNPTTKNVEEGVLFAGKFRPDMIVALGGGSPIDTAKAVNIVRSRGGQIRDYVRSIHEGPLPPLVAIPTTAGTGSEVSPFLLVSDSTTHAKIVIRDNRIIPDMAVLDPHLTVTMPKQVTVLTGVDAMVHSLEAFVAKGAQPYSQGLAMEAIRTIHRTLPEVVLKPNNVELRGRLLIASNLAGMALTMSYLGLAHSMANPLTRTYGMTHGLAVGLMIPYVIKFNEPVAGDEYLRVAAGLLETQRPSPPGEVLRALREEIKRFLCALGLPKNLEEAGVQKEDLLGMSQEAITQATAKSNPRPASVEDILSIYQNAYTGDHEPKQRAHSPQLTAGLASEPKTDRKSS